MLPVESKNIAVVYNHILGRGGVPEDIRSFSRALSALNNVSECSSLAELRRVENLDVVVCVGYSSLTSFGCALYAKYRRKQLWLMPLNQINTFLDHYRPFSSAQSPIVSDLEKGTQGVEVEENVVRTSSFLRRLLRKVWRRTFGDVLLRCTDRVLVLSEYEKTLIEQHAGNRNLAYTGVKFIAAHDQFSVIGNAVYDNAYTNIVMWTRIDPFFKGIDNAILAVHKLLESRSSVRLYLIGPDFSGGVNYVKSVFEGKLENVFILGPGDYESGSVKLLVDADIVLSVPRWDGQPRTLREALSLGKVIVANKQSNFDFFQHNKKVFIAEDASLHDSLLRAVDSLSDPDALPGESDITIDTFIDVETFRN